jgi:hypothetical protein
MLFKYRALPCSLMVLYLMLRRRLAELCLWAAALPSTRVAFMLRL